MTEGALALLWRMPFRLMRLALFLRRAVTVQADEQLLVLHVISDTCDVVNPAMQTRFFPSHPGRRHDC